MCLSLYNFPFHALLDVLDVICQCFEVRSSTDDYQLSQLSGCSIKMERRMSISDVRLGGDFFFSSRGWGVAYV